jgi:ankyrin repeat protein
LTLDTELLQAIFQGELSLVQSLLAQGANPNIYGTISPRRTEIKDRGNTPLMWAADEGFTSIALALLDAGAEIDARNAANYTALMYATESGRVEVMGLLLARGAAVDGRNLLSRTRLTKSITHNPLPLYPLPFTLPNPALTKASSSHRVVNRGDRLSHLSRQLCFFPTSPKVTVSAPY